jgi:hypothetical protein
MLALAGGVLPVPAWIFLRAKNFRKNEFFRKKAFDLWVSFMDKAELIA